MSACIGGAIDLVTCCDMRYAAADAVFSVREIDVGLVADVGTLQRLPRDGALLLTLGRLCRQQQLWGKARSYLEASLAITPSRAAHIELAQLLDQLEESALATRHYRAAAVL